LLAANFETYLKGDGTFAVLFEPAARKALASLSDTKNYLLVTELDNVRSRPYRLRFDGGQWTRTPLDAPAFGTISVSGIDSDESDDYFMTVTDFLTPSSL